MRVTTAYILGAGLGTRLAPLTLERPKPLVEVLGTPLIQWALSMVKAAGVRRVAINTHHLPGAIERELGCEFDDVTLTYTHEDPILGTGGGLLGLMRALPPRAGEHVLFLNADALIDLDVTSLLAHANDDALSTLVCKSVPDVDNYGAIGTDQNGRVLDFAGRAQQPGDVVDRRMFCGVHLAWPRVLEVLPQPDGVIVESCINKAGYPTWMKQGARLDTFNHTGAFCDVGTPERLLEINVQLLAGRVRFVHSDPFARFTKMGFGWRGDRVRVHPSAILHGPVLLDDDCVIEAGAVVGPHVVVGKKCVVRANAEVTRSVLQSGAVVHRDLHDAVVGTTCTLPVDSKIVDAVLA